MFPLIVWLAGFPAGQAGGPEVNAEQFARLVAAAQGEIHDISLVYEGKHSTLRSDTSPEEGARDGYMVYGATFQGAYAYREDGATKLDYFADSVDPDGEGKRIRPYRNTSAILRGRLRELSRTPEFRDMRPSESWGGPGSLNTSCSPERIFYSWFFNDYLIDPTGQNYRFLGWEELDGHRTLNVEMDQFRGMGEIPRKERPLIRLWIDLERGGHPLRADFLRGRDVEFRTVDIRLAQVVEDTGKSYWIPIRGRMENFSYGTGFARRPTAAEYYYVVDGSVRINQDLPDAYFTVEKDQLLARSEALTEREKNFRAPSPRTDPEGVTRRLEAQLADAEGKLSLIEASSPARRRWNWDLLAQSGLVAVGVAAIAAAAWIVRSR